MGSHMLQAIPHTVGPMPGVLGHRLTGCQSKKLIHLQTAGEILGIRTCSLELTLFPDVDVLCAFSDEGNLSLYLSMSDLVQ